MDKDSLHDESHLVYADACKLHAAKTFLAWKIKITQTMKIKLFIKFIYL